MTQAKSVLLVLVVTLAGVALAVGAAGAQELTDVDVSVAVDQAENGSATVTVTANDTAAENATVAVETVDENASYEGTGEYLTDENGTVGLPAPEENVTVAVTADIDNASATTEATLTAVEDNETSFGDLVSSFVDNLLSDNETDGGIGDAVSEFVTENNPAADKIPGHAGPPENKTGPPEHAGPGDDDDKRGPPEHAGPDGEDEDADDEEDEEEEDDEEDDDGQGPPDNAGP